VHLSRRGLHAEGRIAALLPMAYWVDYELETDGDLVTRRMRVEGRWSGGSATIDVLRDEGRWTVDGEPRPDLDGALDVDLAGCPLTNVMPIRRHELHRRPGGRELLMAYIEVPGLRVVPNDQRYTHVRALDDGGAVVTYESGSFRSDLTVDADGFVIDYPRLGRRVVSVPAAPGVHPRSAKLDTAGPT
jgi:hypothetical protein